MLLQIIIEKITLKILGTKRAIQFELRTADLFLKNDCRGNLVYYIKFPTLQHHNNAFKTTYLFM